MQLTKTNGKGSVFISLSAIASIAGNAAVECYGVLGLANKTLSKDQSNQILDSNEYSKAISVKETKNGVEINMFIVVAYGLKITEIVSEVQKKVRYVLKKALDINFSAVNVYVQSIKSL